jgi:pyruvate,water dikinase
MADWSNVTAGDIIVAPVIDPGMAPLFGIAGGLIVEMGGMLSHGAIIAREYGLPTVANVVGAMTRLHEGQRVKVDAGSGTIRLEEILDSHSVAKESRADCT